MTTIRLTTALLLAATLMACTDHSSSSNATVTQLGVGDANCPGGGVSITANGTTAYACSGANGQTGTKGDPGLQGAKGDQGLPGAVGGGLYTNRDAVYCDTVTATSQPGTASDITATCRTATDLPLSGSCDQFSREDVALATASDFGTWHGANSTAPAQFVCAWSKAGVGVFLNTISSAKAHICCVTVP